MKKLLFVFLLIAQFSNPLLSQAYKTNPPKLPLDLQTGEKWMYGLNTNLLACLVEVIIQTS